MNLEITDLLAAMRDVGVRSIEFDGDSIKRVEFTSQTVREMETNFETMSAQMRADELLGQSEEEKKLREALLYSSS